MVYSHSLLVHSQSRGQAIIEYLAHVYALSPIEEVFFFLRRKVNTKKPFMMESVLYDPMTLFLQTTTIDTAGGLTIDCNLFTMARACVRAKSLLFSHFYLSTVSRFGG